VVVTNSDGSSETLAGGFIYKAATLELSKSDVSAGDTIVRCHQARSACSV
jgi:hypothetical protein